MLLLILVLLITAGPAAADSTTVTTDQERSAVVIDAQRPGSSSSRPHQPCLEYVMGARQEGLLPGDTLIAIPCRGSGVRRVTRALREQVVRYLPPLVPQMAPTSDALVNVPQIFWSNQRTIRFDVTVLGRAVTVVMHPRFEWRFGDGAALSTSKSGSPYPSRDLVHTYREPCRCAIDVITTWSGQWSDGSAWYPLGSVLTQQREMRLQVRRAPIRLVE